MKPNTSEATQEWLLSHRRAWYAQTDLHVTKVHEREFMAVWGGETRRHLSYPDKKSLQSAMAGCPPEALYSSVAHYKAPGSPWMAEKGWMYAELIFDLDYDHMECALFDEIADGNMEDDTWARSQRKALECIDFCKDKLGTDVESVAFSGNRGFHVRINDPRYMILHSRGRRNLAMFVNDAAGLDIDAPVLVDVHRVTRTPGSLHPSTGLACMLIDPSDLKRFTPDMARPYLGGVVKLETGRTVRDGYAYELATRGLIGVDPEWWSDQETKAPSGPQLIL